LTPGPGSKAGPETGDAAKFTSMEEVGAIWKQYDYFLEKGHARNTTSVFLAKGEFLCAPFSTSLQEDSITTGKDSTEEGGDAIPQLNTVIVNVVVWM
jgi:hypothetical protein